MLGGGKACGVGFGEGLADNEGGVEPDAILRTGSEDAWYWPVTLSETP